MWCILVKNHLNKTRSSELCLKLLYFQDNAIVVWFSNRAGSVDTFAGTSAISYEVQCNDLPSGGVDRTAVNNLAAK